MFVGHQVVFETSFFVARDRLTRFIREGWLQDASDKAHADGLVGVARVGPFGAVLGASKLVRVRVLDPVPRPDALVAPLRWEATGAMGRLFPVLDADIALTPAAGGGTQLTLMGAYRPPFAGIGSGLDRLVLHRVASLTIRSLVQQVLDALADPVADCYDLRSPNGQGPAVPGPGLLMRPKTSS